MKLFNFFLKFDTPTETGVAADPLHHLTASAVTNGVGGGSIIEGSYGVYRLIVDILG